MSCAVPQQPHLYSAVRESSQWSQLVQHQQILARRGDAQLHSLTDPRQPQLSQEWSGRHHLDAASGEGGTLSLRERFAISGLNTVSASQCVVHHTSDHRRHTRDPSEWQQASRCHQNRLCGWAPTSSASCRLARLRTTAAGESSVNACVNRSKRRRRRVKSHHVRVRAPPTLLVYTSECGDSSHRVLFSLHIRRRARSMLAARIHRYRCLREVTASECKRSRTASPHTHHSGVSETLAIVPECRACDVCPSSTFP